MELNTFSCSERSVRGFRGEAAKQTFPEGYVGEIHCYIRRGMDELRKVDSEGNKHIGGSEKRKSQVTAGDEGCYR